MSRTEGLRPGLTDLLVVLGFMATAEVERAVASQITLVGSAPAALDVVLVLLPVVPLWWRRTRPFAAIVAVAVVLTFVGAVLHGSLTYFGGLFVVLVALYSASSRSPRPWDSVALVVPVVFLMLLPLYAGQHFKGESDLIPSLVLCFAGWLAGQGVRRWREQSERLAVALSRAEASRALQAELAVADERVRLARELHDVITHSLSVSVLHARAARLSVRDDVDSAEQSLDAVEASSREALTEMRRLLGVLRSAPEASLEPQPGLAQLPDLADRMGRAGLPVTITGDPPERLSTALDLTAYRILQESLTNALAHGGGASADVVVDATSACLHLKVTNPLAAHPPAKARRLGHGLVGIRERALLFGGTATFGPDGVGRFVVDVTLPIVGPA